MSGSASDEPLEFIFPPDPDFLRLLRKSLRQRLEDLGVSEDVSDAVVLVVDELVTNSIEHAVDFRDGPGQLRVALTQRGARIALEYEDPDVPSAVVAELTQVLAISTRRVTPPRLEAERGRGLFLVARNIQALRVEALPGGGLRLLGEFNERDSS